MALLTDNDDDDDDVAVSDWREPAIARKKRQSVERLKSSWPCADRRSAAGTSDGGGVELSPWMMPKVVVVVVVGAAVARSGRVGGGIDISPPCVLLSPCSK